MGGVCGKDKTVYDVEIIKNQEPVENKKSSENPEPNSGPLKAPSDSEEISKYYKFFAVPLPQTTLQYLNYL